MVATAAGAELRDVPVNLIDRNPENPRIFFRAAELETLLNSIRRHGVQVPISVYKTGSRYVLMDGERRWRCSLKLNKKTIPALVHKRPDALGNLLLMFNIHALREQWDLLTIAMKLPRVIELLQDQKGNGKKATEAEIADETGLPRATIRRSRLLLDMPAQYRDQLIGDLQKPKREQKLSEDFFIELERSLKTVERALPEALPKKDIARDVLIQKYKTKIIPNLVDLRYIPKIAHATNVSADPGRAARVLKKLFEPNQYSPKKAFEESVAEAYTERDVVSRIEALVAKVEELDVHSMESEFREKLRGMLARLIALLEKLS
jgi:ParB family transcriptional regulator, chromosome partitioning protein